MKCPECQHEFLSPFKLEPDLGAMGCEKRHGALLDLVAYRLWQELRASELDSQINIVEEPQQDLDTRSYT